MPYLVLCLALFELQVLIFGVVNTATLRCGPDAFWQESTKTCESCGKLCDPPYVYKISCPEFCPAYKPKPGPAMEHDENIPQELVIIAILCSMAFVSGFIFVFLVYKRIGPFKKVRDWFSCERIRYSVEEEVDNSQIGLTTPCSPCLGRHDTR